MVGRMNTGFLIQNSEVEQYHDLRPARLTLNDDHRVSPTGEKQTQALHLSTASLNRLANSPGSKFNRHGGSILNRRQHLTSMATRQDAARTASCPWA